MGFFYISYEKMPFLRNMTSFMLIFYNWETEVLIRLIRHLRFCFYNPSALLAM